MPLALLPVLVDTHAAGVSEAAIAHTWAHGIRPAIDGLGRAPHARAALHLSGPTLRWADLHDPGALELLAELVEKRRVQMLASGAEGPLLSLVPERDAVAQVRRHLRELQGRLAARTTVLWPAALAWDPRLAEVLKKTGLDTTFIDEGLLRVGATRPGPIDGWAEGSFHGAHVRFLPVDRVLSAVAPWTPVSRVRAHLGVLADQGRRLATMVVPADRLAAATGERSWWGELLDGLKSSKVRTLLPSRALEDVACACRSHPPAGTPPLIRHAVHATARVEALDWTTLHADPTAPAGPPVEALVAEEPAGERILARTRRLSDALALARREARKRRQTLAPVDAATAALQRAQSGAALHTLAHLGGHLTDPAVRAAAWQQIDAAMEAVSAGEPPWEQTDLYGDGADELELSTPSLLATLSTRRGGAITELLLRGVGNFANASERRPSPERTALCAPPPLPVLVDEDAGAPEEEPALSLATFGDEEATDPGIAQFPAPPAAPDISDELGALLRPDDHHPRLVFQERLLGEATTLDSLRSGQYPEQGDFLGGSWRLERAERNDQGALEVVMVREGIVRQEPEPPGMIQVHKRLVFGLDSPQISVSYEVVNRSREPVGSTLAVELNLGLDGRCDTARTLHLPGMPPVATTASGDHPQMNDFALRYADIGVLLRIRPLRPARVLHHPVHRMHTTPTGVHARQQCTAVLFAWPLQLWGEERWQTGLTLHFHRSDRGR